MDGEQGVGYQGIRIHVPQRSTLHSSSSRLRATLKLPADFILFLTNMHDELSPPRFLLSHPPPVQHPVRLRC